MSVAMTQFQAFLDETTYPDPFQSGFHLTLGSANLIQLYHVVLYLPLSRPSGGLWIPLGLHQLCSLRTKKGIEQAGILPKGKGLWGIWKQWNRPLGERQKLDSLVLHKQQLPRQNKIRCLTYLQIKVVPPPMRYINTF